MNLQQVELLKLIRDYGPISLKGLKEIIYLKGFLGEKFNDGLFGVNSIIKWLLHGYDRALIEISPIMNYVRRSVYCISLWGLRELKKREI